MSWNSKLELNFGFGEAPSLLDYADEISKILEQDSIAEDVLADLLLAFDQREGTFNLVGAYIAELLRKVALLIPSCWIEARITGEDYRDTVIMQIENGQVVFEAGPWPYE